VRFRIEKKVRNQTLQSILVLNNVLYSHNVCCLVEYNSGVAKNFNWGARLSSFPSLPQFIPSLFYLFPFPLFPCPPFFPSSPLEVGPPIIQLRGLGERCELPQRGLRQSSSRNRIWCILALKMRSGGNDFNYFKLFLFYFKQTKSAILVQFKCMVMFCLEDWGAGPPLAMPLEYK